MKTYSMNRTVEPTLT